MKRIVSLLLSIAFILSIASGCGKTETASPAENKPSVTEVKVTFPCSTGTKAIVEGETVLATQAYMLSRAYIEKLETYDMDTFDAQEYSALAANALEALRITEALSASLEQHAAVLAQIEETAPVSQEKATFEELSMSQRRTSLIPVAYAEEESEAVRFAEDLTKTFDEAETGGKLKAVAEKYGTDVKRAKVMLEQAQAILDGETYTNQAELENKWYEAAVETKAAASAIGFGVAVAASGGIAAGGVTAAGLSEAGGLAFSGVNAIIDMGTAVTIHETHGEGNEYTAAWEKTGAMYAPLSAVFSLSGGIQNIVDFRNPEKAAQAVDNAAQALLVGLGAARDYLQDDTVMGVNVSVFGGKREVTIRTAETSDPEAVKAVLEKTGIPEAAQASPEQTPQAQPLSEADTIIQSMKAVTDPENPMDLDASLSAVDDAFAQALQEEGLSELTPLPEKSEEPEVSDEAEDPEDAAEPEVSDEAEDPEDTAEPETDETSETTGGLSAADVVGTYVFTQDGRSTTYTYKRVDDTHLKMECDGYTPETGSYDPKTGTFVFYETDEFGGETMTSEIKTVFSAEKGGIKAILSLSVDGELFGSLSAMKE